MAVGTKPGPRGHRPEIWSDAWTFRPHLSVSTYVGAGRLSRSGQRRSRHCDIHVQGNLVPLPTAGGLHIAMAAAPSLPQLFTLCVSQHRSCSVRMRSAGRRSSRPARRPQMTRTRWRGWRTTGPALTAYRLLPQEESLPFSNHRRTRDGLSVTSNPEVQLSDADLTEDSAEFGARLDRRSPISTRY